MSRIAFPPRHVLAYEYFRLVALILASDGTVSISGDESYITVENLDSYCNHLIALAKRGMRLWFSGNDKRILSRVRDTIRANDFTLNELVKAYTTQIRRGGVNTIEGYESEKFSATSILKTTLYEYGRGYGVSFKERVELSINQLILSLLGASVSKIGEVRTKQESLSVYLLPFRGQDIVSYCGYVDHLRRIPVDTPYSVKCLHLALKALDVGDASDTYGVELMVSERGNRATLIDLHYASTSGLAYTLIELAGRLKTTARVKLLKWCLSTLLKSYIKCYEADDESYRVAKVVESFCEFLLCYVNTGSLDYKYNALSVLKRILDDEVALNKCSTRLSLSVDDLRRAIDVCVDMLSQLESIVERRLL